LQEVVFTSVERNKALVRRLVDAWNTRNLAALDELIAPDCIDHYATAGETRGRDWYKQDLVDFIKGFPDSQWAVEDIIGEGDKVVVRLTLCGTHRGKFSGIKPTGKRIGCPEISIWRIANGKLVEEWGFGDRLGALQQLGVVPPIDRVGK